MIPSLETERLRLRAPRMSDLDPFAAFYATDASRFVDGPKDRVNAWRSLATSLGGWALRGYGEFSVEDKETGAFVGLVGPWYPEGWPEPEIAWIILPDFQNRGYGAEAAGRVLAFVYGDLGWKTAISCIDDDNLASIRLAEKLGARREGKAEFRPLGMMPYYRHLPAEIFLCNTGTKH